MSIYHTPNHKVTEASARIAQHIAEYQRNGGVIQQIPVGRSGFEITPRNSDAGKQLSIGRNKAKAERKAAKKKERRI